MQSFKLSTEVKMFACMEEFVNTMQFNDKDVIVTNAPIYEPILKPYHLPCKVVFQENYGTGEPSDTMMNAIIKDLKGFKYERVFAIGGGTVIDVAKVLALAGVNDVLDAMYGRIPIARGSRLLVVPTTCGTGSEVTNIAIFEDTASHVKKGVVGPALYPDEALLVPEMLKNLPYRFFALSSVDALIHAMESYLAPASNPITEMFAIEAVKKIIPGYRNIARQGQGAQAANTPAILLASTYAGIAFGNTGVGAVHAMSYPLGGMYHVPHGEANYAFLGVVFAKYAQLKPMGKIVDLQKLLAGLLEVEQAGAFPAMEELLSTIVPLKKLREYGAREEEMEAFADAAMEQERLMKNNYVPLAREVVLSMYKARY